MWTRSFVHVLIVGSKQVASATASLDRASPLGVYRLKYGLMANARLCARVAITQKAFVTSAVVNIPAPHQRVND